ncbi:MAG: acetate--CoA ligase family protein [Deltaproteobacteria bacterium]|nr:acetate--CoA ligase family protein [Deltaproteobacteria bacterium]MBW2398151.1 acetate--CoA ligase family protein [Deltaproteobacteria bacterium]
MSTAEPRRPRQDLTPLLHARSVAIVGISGPERFGGILFDNLRQFGYAGEIFGVNPRYETLYGRPCYPSLRELPERPDCALLAVPNARIALALEEVADCGIPAAAIFASAWSEPGAEPSLQQQLQEVAQASSMVVCGPNCMGFVSTGRRLPISGYRVNPATPTGHVTLISHSGSVWEGFLQNQRGVAFNYIVSPGNEMVTTVADYMQFALADESTRVIGLFLETVRDVDTFLAALEEAAERDVPVVVLKSGRSERGARLAQAHSGALAGDNAAIDAIFDRYGVRRATSIDEMMDTLELLQTGMRPERRGLAAVLDSGGQRAHMVDLAETLGVEFAAISSATEARLAAVLEPGLDPINPLDAWGTGNASDDIYVESTLALDSDPATGLTLFAVDLPPTDDEEMYYPEIAETVQGRLQNPLAFMVHASASASAPQMSRLRELGIPVLLGTETGLRAAQHVVEYAAFQRTRAQAKDEPREVERPPQLGELRQQLETATEALDEHASKQLLRAYGLTTTQERAVATLADALGAAEEIGYPIALKTAAGDLHKTERGGVRLGVADPDELAAAYRDFEARLGPRVLVQEMVPDGCELLLGLVFDAQFGPMLSIATGGIFVEVLKDFRMLPLPTTSAEVADALASLRGAPLLHGVRGRPPADLEAIVRAALSLAALASDLGDCIAEVDVNPLVALPDRAVVVDALVVPKTNEPDERT